MTWKALRWWESAGMVLDDAPDTDERLAWECAPYIRIEDETGQSVVSCHDLSTISADNARLIAKAPELRTALLWLLQMTVETSNGAFPTKPAMDNARALLAAIDGGTNEDTPSPK